MSSTSEVGHAKNVTNLQKLSNKLAFTHFTTTGKKTL